MKLATFNVRGLTSQIKRKQLAMDMDSYGIDFCSLQELKTTEAFDQRIALDKDKTFRIVSLGQNSGKHGGLGFAVSPRIQPFLTKYRKLSDRVGYADFKLPQRKKGVLDMRIVTAYGPTQPLAEKKSSVRDQFYDELSAAGDSATSRTLVLYAGDFNSKVGSQSAACVGQYGKGTRNENGHALVQWATAKGLLLANTLFRYSQRFRTTWTGWVRDTTSSERSKKPIYNMIDYILIPEACRPLVRRARSYSGTTLCSDHRVVISELLLDAMFKVHKVPQPRERPLAVSKLSDSVVAKQFSDALTRKLDTGIDTDVGNPSDAWDGAAEIIKKTAESVVGYMVKSKRGLVEDSPIIRNLSEQQKQLRLQLQCPNLDDERRRSLTTERNRISHAIRRQCLEDANNRLDQRAEEVQSAPDTVKMFEAASLFRKSDRSSIIVESRDGHALAQDRDKANTVREHFASLLQQ